MFRKGVARMFARKAPNKTNTSKADKKFFQNSIAATVTNLPLGKVD